MLFRSVLQNYVKMFNKKKHVTAANNNKCHRYFYFIIPTPNDSPDNMHSINKLLERGDTVTSLLLHVAIEYIVLQNYVKMFNKKKHVTAANNNKCHRYFIIPSPSDVLGLGSGPQAHQAQPKKSLARPGPVVGPMRAQGWA